MRKSDTIMIGKKFVILIQLIALCSGETLETFVGKHFQKESANGCDGGMLCVPPYLCINGTINTEGVGLIDHRSNLKCEIPNVCCGRKQTTTTEASNTDSTTSTDSTEFTKRKGCGYRAEIDTTKQNFKTGPTDPQSAEYGEFPWTMAILRKRNPSDENFAYNSVGSLLTPQVVLTSASKVHTIPPNQLIVRAGAYDNENIQLNPEEDISVDRIIIHEKFNNANHFNNIALLFLKQPVNFSVVVNTICLPPIGASFDFQDCFGTGWGKLDFKRKAYAQIMKKRKLQIVLHEKCEENLRKTQLSEYFELNESFLCAGGEKGEDMCTGDGGAPLVCSVRNSPKQFYQVGIVSWGINCGLENVPGVYTNVRHLRPWIDAKLSAENVNATFYTP